MQEPAVTPEQSAPGHNPAAKPPESTALPQCGSLHRRPYKNLLRFLIHEDTAQSLAVLPAAREDHLIIDPYEGLHFLNLRWEKDKTPITGLRYLSYGDRDSNPLPHSTQRGPSSNPDAVPLSC